MFRTACHCHRVHLVALAVLVLAPLSPAGTARADATGFFVGAEGYFVSAHHVLSNCAFVGIKTPDGVVIGDLVASSAADDLAVVKTNRRPRHYGRLPKDPALALHNPVLIARFSGSGDPASLRIIVAEYDGPDPFRKGFVRFRAHDTIRGGDSGSPVISQHGAVLAVLVARDRERSYMGVAADAFRLSRFLHDAGVAFETESEIAANRIGGDLEKAGRFTFPVTCLK